MTLLGLNVLAVALVGDVEADLMGRALAALAGIIILLSYASGLGAIWFDKSADAREG